MRKILIIGLAMLVLENARATIFYVATNGSDAASGTSTSTPFATPQKAVSVGTLTAGDTIYIRGGTYMLGTNVSPGSSKVGAPGNPIKFWAYPGEHPVFNFSSMSGSAKALEMRRSYWWAKGIEVKNGPNTGILVAGNGVIIEGCTVHDCGFDGIVLGSSSSPCTNATIKNCDSYHNVDLSTNGEDGDGFAGKSGCGPGNTFVGCRSFLNCDDGWDFYDAGAKSVTFTNCWSFLNGTNDWGISSFQGDGNGYKLGGASTSVGHTLIQCLAFRNRLKGFDYNNSHGDHTMVNCTGFNNNLENYKFPVVPATGVNRFTNCVSYAGGGIDIVAGSIQISNSWQNGLSVSASDFVSLDVSLAMAPRNDDYSLPTNGLARLAAGSDLIDAGINVGLPYNGPAPDLGAYEYVAVVLPQNILIDAVSQTDTGLSLHVTGLTSHGNIIVHTSPDLATWTPIYTNPPVTGGWQYIDPDATNTSQRFYKVQEQ